MKILMTQLEQAINFWRERMPSAPGEHKLCAPAAALAQPYALMILAQLQEIDTETLDSSAREAYEEWLATQPGAP